MRNTKQNNMKKIKNPWIGIEGYNCVGCCPDNEIGLKMVRGTTTYSLSLNLTRVFCKLHTSVLPITHV